MKDECRAENCTRNAEKWFRKVVNADNKKGYVVVEIKVCRQHFKELLGGNPFE